MNTPIETISRMVALYDSGMNVKEVAARIGFSTGKTYALLRDAGCKFRPRFSQAHSAETRKKLSEALTGRIVSTETKRMISEARKCHFNGLNGFGHTKKHPKGYELVYAPEHPKAHKDGYVMKHTVVAERSIGRYLLPSEEVHHINHIRDDNRTDNLVVMDSHEHRRMHMMQRCKGGMTY